MTYQTSQQGMEKIRTQLLEQKAREIAGQEKIQKTLAELAGPELGFRIPAMNENAVNFMRAQARAQYRRIK